MRSVAGVGMAWLVPAMLWVGCTVPEIDGDHLTLEIASLGVSGLGDARYTVIVTQGGPNGPLVWAGSVSSAKVGADDGSLSTDVVCDAEAGANSVTLVLDALYDTRGAVIDPDRYENPTPVTVTADCAPEGAGHATFDVTVARHERAEIIGESVSFGGIRCAARVQCERPSDGADLALLSNPRLDGARDMTAILELACDGAGDATTRLYLDDPVVRCDGLDADIVIDAGGLGQVDLDAAPSHNPDGYLFAAAVNRQIEEATGIARWTVALGLDEAAFAAAGECRLVARASASDRPLALEAAGWELPRSIVYPVVSWDVALTDASGRVCGNHEVSPETGIDVRYAGYGGAPGVFVWGEEPVCFCHRYTPMENAMSSATP